MSAGSSKLKARGPKLRVALIGKSGAGKSEVAKVLNAEYGAEVIKTGAICRSISQLLFGNQDKGSTQKLDDALTRIDESIFLRAALRTANLAKPFVIDSLRFRSDLVLARENGCMILRVVSGDNLRVSRLVARGQVFDLAENGAHRSENELDDAACDATLSNTGNLEELAEKVRATFR